MVAWRELFLNLVPFTYLWKTSIQRKVGIGVDFIL